ncbi:hypothetical protein ACA910_000930 [Epithemia clementina (nom. ined.)]
MSEISGAPGGSSLPSMTARLSLKRARYLFDTGDPSSVFVPPPDPILQTRSKDRRRRLLQRSTASALTSPKHDDHASRSSHAIVAYSDTNLSPGKHVSKSLSKKELALVSEADESGYNHQHEQNAASSSDGGGILVRSAHDRASAMHIPTPKWHAPWKLATVLSSHLGWVRSIAFSPDNQYMATGSADRTIKIWDFPKASVGADQALKLTLTGHVSPVRGLAFSDKYPYLFSCAEDKQVRCWDLETNQVIRHYHGHLSGVFCLALHPTLDILVTGGRDAVARVWDMRTKIAIHVLAGHEHTIASLLTKSTNPQVITGSHDNTIKMWDLAAGKCFTTLTHHQKSIRALVQPTFEHTFLSGAADCLKKWQGKDGRFLKSFTGHKAIVNAMAVNDDGVLVSGGDDGSLHFWDYQTGYPFQQAQASVQPGSLAAENSIMALAFDLTGTRLISGEADKTIKVWKQDDAASELSHPIDMLSWRKKCIAESKQRF